MPFDTTDRDAPDLPGPALPAPALPSPDEAVPDEAVLDPGPNTAAPGDVVLDSAPDPAAPDVSSDAPPSPDAGHASPETPLVAPTLPTVATPPTDRAHAVEHPAPGLPIAPMPMRSTASPAPPPPPAPATRGTSAPLAAPAPAPSSEPALAPPADRDISPTPGPPTGPTIAAPTTPDAPASPDTNPPAGSTIAAPDAPDAPTITPPAGPTIATPTTPAATPSADSNLAAPAALAAPDAPDAPAAPDASATPAASPPAGVPTVPTAPSAPTATPPSGPTLAAPAVPSVPNVPTVPTVAAPAATPAPAAPAAPTAPTAPVAASPTAAVPPPPALGEPGGTAIPPPPAEASSTIPTPKWKRRNGKPKRRVLKALIGIVVLGAIGAGVWFGLQQLSAEDSAGSPAGATGEADTIIGETNDLVTDINDRAGVDDALDSLGLDETGRPIEPAPGGAATAPASYTFFWDDPTGLSVGVEVDVATGNFLATTDDGTEIRRIGDRYFGRAPASTWVELTSDVVTTVPVVGVDGPLTAADVAPADLAPYIVLREVLDTGHERLLIDDTTLAAADPDLRARWLGPWGLLDTAVEGGGETIATPDSVPEAAGPGQVVLTIFRDPAGSVTSVVVSSPAIGGSGVYTLAATSPDPLTVDIPVAETGD